MMDEQYTPESDQFLGCLLGLAIGDAFGMPVEGWPASAIRERFGWLDTYVPRRGASGDILVAAGEITDDTEMTLCHVESLVTAGGLVDPENTGMRFLRLFNSESQQFMGATTRQSLERAQESGDFQCGLGGEYAAGNGVAMRVAPIGLVHSVGRFNPEVFSREILRAGLITHSNPIAINGGLAIAYAVRLLAARQATPDVLLQEVVSFIDEDEVARQIRLASELVAQPSDRDGHLEHLRRIGTSGYAVESVAAALYCFASFPDDFRDAVTLAVNAGGDTDSVAAMTGAMSGAHLGARALPADLVEGLAGRAYILMASPGLYETAMRRGGKFIRLRTRP
jgi:ADP-ribosyl-[dinitrogen reductase] hydrolase